MASLACASNESVTFSGKLEQLYAYFSTAGEDARIFGAVATAAVEKRRRSTLGGLWSTGSLKKLVMMKEARTPPMSREDRSPAHATIRIDGSSENGRLGNEDGGRYALVSKHTCRAALLQLFQTGFATTSPLMIIRPRTRICAHHRCSVFEQYSISTTHLF